MPQTAGRYLAISLSLFLCLPVTGQQATTGPNVRSSEIEQLKQKVDDLAAAFESFKRTNTELAEDLSELSTTVLPVGSIVAFAGTVESVPKNWLPCDGRTVSAEQYKVLWDRINTMWGGTGETAFRLPDLQGRFLRGVDGGTHRDPEAEKRTPNGKKMSVDVGSTQDDALQIHKHEDSGHVHGSNISNLGYRDSFACNPAQCGALTVNASVTVAIDKGKAVIGGPTSISETSPVRVALETRVKNAYVYWIIRVK